MKKLIYLDTCQPDYFQGFSGDTLIAFHWKGQTIKEALENLEHNALNEGRDEETFNAIDQIKNDNIGSSSSLIIDEKYCEADENNDTGLVHYFGIIETTNMEQQ